MGKEITVRFSDLLHALYITNEMLSVLSNYLTFMATYTCMDAVVIDLDAPEAVPVSESRQYTLLHVFLFFFCRVLVNIQSHNTYVT